MTAGSNVDAVIFFAVLTCIVDNAGRRTLIDEILRKLNPDRILYINDFLANTDERNITRCEKFKDIISTEPLKFPREPYADTMTPGGLMGCFLRLRIAMESLTFTTMNGNKSNGFYYFGKKRN